MILARDLTQLVATYELPEVQTPDDEVFGGLKFIIQVLRLPTGAFVPRVMRKDRVLVRPAYLEDRQELLDQATVEIIVPDDSSEWEAFLCDSERDALQCALDELQRLLGR